MHETPLREHSRSGGEGGVFGSKGKKVKAEGDEAVPPILEGGDPPAILALQHGR